MILEVWRGGVWTGVKYPRPSLALRENSGWNAIESCRPLSVFIHVYINTSFASSLPPIGQIDTILDLPWIYFICEHAKIIFYIIIYIFLSVYPFIYSFSNFKLCVFHRHHLSDCQTTQNPGDCFNFLKTYRLHFHLHLSPLRKHLCQPIDWRISHKPPDLQLFPYFIGILLNNHFLITHNYLKYYQHITILKY